MAEQSSPQPVDDLDGKWEKFKVDFNRKYEGPEEDARRKELFKSTVEMVEAHNAEHAKGLVTFKMGINHFADLTKEEKARYTGLRPPTKSSTVS